jgi:hypothetical protein
MAKNKLFVGSLANESNGAKQSTAESGWLNGPGDAKYQAY